jgi:hypothetical protein
MTERPSARRSPFAPPESVQKAIIKRNPKAKPIPAIALEPEDVERFPQAVPAKSSRPEAPVDLTQQDAIDLVFSLTESIESANANVARWAHKGDPHRMEAANTQAKRFETLRERIAAAIPKLTRKG